MNVGHRGWVRESSRTRRLDRCLDIGVVGMRLPGRNALLIELGVKFHKPVLCGDRVTLQAKVADISPSVRLIDLKITANVGGKKVASGNVGVLVR